MRSSALAFALSLCLAGPVLAQTSAPVAPSSPIASASPAADTTKSGKPKAKSVRKACRAEAKAQGLKGDERRRAVSACFVKQRPDLAAKEGVREQCVADAKSKGLKKDARKSFVKDCVKTKG